MNELQVKIEEGVALLTLNRPEQRNALNGDLLHGLKKTIGELNSESSVKVICITGSGDQVFCAGADLKQAATGKTIARGDYRNLLLEIHQSPKPTVALAKGHVLAGGLGILLACDFALACDDVQFSAPEINVGMFPMMVMAFLIRNAGRRRAIEMAFFGDKYSADEALAYRIINRAFTRDDFDFQAKDFLRKLTSKSGAIMRLGKEALQKTEDLPVTESLEMLEKYLENVMATEDSKEGIKAFIEKRKPQWKDA